MWENYFCNLSNGWALGICKSALKPHLHHRERVKKHKRSTVWRLSMGLRDLSFHPVLAADKRVRSVSYIFWPLDTITLWSSSLKCHSALWLHSGADTGLLMPVHADSQQPQGEPGPMSRSAHMYLFMGKTKFPKFCLCNLSFNHQVLWKQKPYF